MLNQYEYLIPEEDPYTWQKIEARSFQDAAGQACEREDFQSNDYTIARQGGVDEVLIRDSSGVVKKFSVYVDIHPLYFAREANE